MSFLEIKDTTLKFGGVTAVDNLSFSVEEGEVFAIVGPNGAGKSTVFNLISRFYTPIAGSSITFDGHDLLKSKASEVAAFGVARTFQNIELFDQATVLENLLVGRHRHRGTHAIDNSRRCCLATRFFGNPGGSRNRVRGIGPGMPHHTKLICSLFKNLPDTVTDD